MCIRFTWPSPAQSAPLLGRSSGGEQYSASPSTSQSGQSESRGLDADVLEDLVRPLVGDGLRLPEGRDLGRRPGRASTSRRRRSGSRGSRSTPGRRGRPGGWPAEVLLGREDHRDQRELELVHRHALLLEGVGQARRRGSPGARRSPGRTSPSPGRGPGNASSDRPERGELRVGQEPVADASPRCVGGERPVGDDQAVGPADLAVGQHHGHPVLERPVLAGDDRLAVLVADQEPPGSLRGAASAAERSRPVGGRGHRRRGRGCRAGSGEAGVPRGSGARLGSRRPIGSRIARSCEGGPGGEARSGSSSRALLGLGAVDGRVDRVEPRAEHGGVGGRIGRTSIGVEDRAGRPSPATPSRTARLASDPIVTRMATAPVVHPPGRRLGAAVGNRPEHRLDPRARSTAAASDESQRGQFRPRALAGSESSGCGRRNLRRPEAWVPWPSPPKAPRRGLTLGLVSDLLT